MAVLRWFRLMHFEGAQVKLRTCCGKYERLGLLNEGVLLNTLQPHGPASIVVTCKRYGQITCNGHNVLFDTISMMSCGLSPVNALTPVQRLQTAEAFSESLSFSVEVNTAWSCTLNSVQRLHRGRG